MKKVGNHCATSVALNGAILPPHAPRGSLAMLETLVWLQLGVLLASRVRARDAAKHPTVRRAARTAKKYPVLTVSSAEGEASVPHPCFENDRTEALCSGESVLHQGRVRNPFGSAMTHGGEIKGSSQAMRDSRESGQGRCTRKGSGGADPGFLCK